MTQRAVFFVASLLAVAAVCPFAAAQTTTATVTLNSLVTRTGNRNGVATNIITNADCVASDTLTVSVSSALPQGIGLGVYSGTGSADCSVEATRLLATTIPEQCWEPVTELTPVVAANTSITIPVKRILPHQSAGIGTPNDGMEAVCSELADPANAAGHGPLTLYFVPLNGTSNAGTAAKLQLTFDLQGPVAPTSVKPGPGETRLFLNWTAPTNDVIGYNLYCEPSPDCGSSTLTAGSLPPDPLPNTVKTGKAGSTATSGSVSGLTNYTQYKCFVAGYDTYLNMGALSEGVCGTPQEVNGFFDVYRTAGGTAGGGYCSFGRNTNASGALVGLGLAGVWLARRRRCGSRA